jgi:histone arginine demethylase JMJD6
MTTIDRRRDISYEEFINSYQKPGIPVILENATTVWKSSLMFTPDYFRERFGMRETNYENRKYTLAEILDIAAKSTKENPAPYPIKFNLLTQLPEIFEDMSPLDLNLIKPNWFNSRIFPKHKMSHSIDLFIGGPGNRYSVHKDSYNVHAWLMQLYGEKDIIVFPRDQEKLMYPGKSGIMASRSPIDIFNPNYEKYPEFKKATPIRTTLKAGEVIYIPNGIWHTTIAYCQNISIIVDQLNRSNYKSWRKDVYEYKKEHNHVKAVLDYAAAIVIGTACMLEQLI